VTLVDRVRDQLAQLELDCPVLWEPVRPDDTEGPQRGSAQEHDLPPTFMTEIDRIAIRSNN
jgi:hypothetical protein